MNVHIIRGRLTRDPETVGQEGKVVKFAVAVDMWDFTKQEKYAEFFDCVAFGKQGETAMKYLAKGRDVSLRGKLKSRTYENREGVKVKVWEHIVDELELGPRPAGARDESSRDADEADDAPASANVFG